MVKAFFSSRNPQFMKRWKKVYWQYSKWTSRHRAFPNYLIIGTMKGGTSSLNNYLRLHPDVLPAFKKEIHFFDFNYVQGPNWYHAHFPPKRKMTLGKITGDASPYYIFFPLAAERAYRLLPETKIIVVLRNPVDRAYSHYHHNVRNGRETRIFEDAIDGEFEQIDREEQLIVLNQIESLFKHRHHSYLSRGLYARQLERWLACYDREDVLVLKSEHLFNKTEAVYQQVLRFLGLQSWSPPEFKAWNVSKYPEMKSETREALSRVFEQPNRQLSELLGKDFSWDDKADLFADSHQKEFI